MDGLNYFQLFGLPVQFDLDTEQLTRNYKTLIAQYHPDKVASKNDFEKKQTMMMASKINDAFQTLRHPLDRASFLLRLQALDAESATDTQFSADFLMQQMEWRETLEEATIQEDQVALHVLSEEVDSAYQNLLGQLSEGLSGQQIQSVIPLIRQGRFLDKLIRQIKEQIKQ